MGISCKSWGKIRSIEERLQHRQNPVIPKKKSAVSEEKKKAKSKAAKKK